MAHNAEKPHGKPPYTSYSLDTLAQQSCDEKDAHAGRGEIKRRQVFNHESKQKSTMQIWELEPGASEGLHAHVASKVVGVQGGVLQGSLEEIYYCVAGTGSISVEKSGSDSSIGSEVDVSYVPLSPGKAVMVPPGVRHGVHNWGGDTLRLVLMWGPAEPPQGPRSYRLVPSSAKAAL
eukprot:TRINITY_DN11613_c0_g1_i2.p1 TRINITY_DN11613_c0_g1~~TRINITY_DN11613_c0_g1_i2.p1  ORF type:complete len:177 (-),score=23.33 TRINITY_DN11613_c0_g1_i2:44-574(-)